jgi:predicted MFS family arabinose efflux permease
MAPGSSPRKARYALGVLLCAYVVNHIDRQVMYILMEPVADELSLSDTQMGWLVGLAFAAFYTIAGVPIARLADRSNRRNIIALALLIWSGMTVASGLARNYVQLLAARIGVGVGEAGCTPPAHSLISDYFPPERRATAISIYQVGVPIGTLFGLGMGGYLADELGWRLAFFVVGVPGIALALVVRLTLKEPIRGQSDPGADAGMESLGSVLRFMSTLPSLRHMLLATAYQTLALAAVGAWHPIFLSRVHGMSLTEAGLWLGGIAGASSIPVFLGGFLGDRMSQRDPRWYMWLPAIGAVASIPFSVLAYLADEKLMALAMISCATVGNHIYSAIGHAVMQSLVKPRMRAMMSAIALFAMNIVGYGVGPSLAGYVSDLMGGGVQVRYALIAMVGFLLLAAVHYLLGARTFARDLRAKTARE